MVFTRSVDLAIVLKKHIDSYVKMIPFDESGKTHSWDTLVSFLGVSLTDVNNRTLAIEGFDFTKTMHAKLRPSRIGILTKALKEYSPEEYKDF